MSEPIFRHSASSTKTTAGILLEGTATAVEWRISSPWHRENWETQLGQGLRLLGLLLLIFATVVIITGKLSLALTVVVFVTLIVGYFFIPVTYRIDTAGIERNVLRRRQSKSWTDFESAKMDDRTLWLYPKESVLRGRYRTVLVIPLCKRGSNSAEKIQRLMPLGVQFVTTPQTDS